LQGLELLVTGVDWFGSDLSSLRFSLYLRFNDRPIGQQHGHKVLHLSGFLERDRRGLDPDLNLRDL